MTVVDAGATVLATILAGAVGIGTARVLLRSSRGAVFALVATIVAIGFVVTTATVLGLLGLLSRGFIIGTWIAAAAPVVWWSRRSPLPHAGEDRPARPDAVGALLVATVASAQWTAVTLDGLGDGVRDYDSLHYHLPMAARFAQDHGITSLHHVSPEPFQAFHPMNSELINAVGVSLARSDVLVPVLALGWLWLGLLGGWVAGSIRDRGALCVLAVAVVASGPLMSRQAGTALNDMAATALVVASVALAGRAVVGRPALAALAGERRRLLLLAGLAAGLAVGTKLTTAVLVAGLSFVVVGALMRAGRRRLAGGWVAIAFAGGGVWFARNLFRTGSVLPSVGLGVGPVRLPSPEGGLMQEYSHAIVEYADESAFWSQIALPAFRIAWGDVWWLLLVAGVLGAAGAILWGSGAARALGAVAMVGVLAYPFTPLTAAGPAGAPDFGLVVSDTRYLAPGLALALLAGTFAIASRRSAHLVAGPLLVFLFLAAHVDSGPLAGWPVGSRREAAVIAVAGGVLATVVALLRPRVRLTTQYFTGVLVIVASVFGLGALERRASEYRYVTGVNAAQTEFLRFGSATTGARIAISGVTDHFPLYGPDLDNHVQQLGVEQPNGGYRAPRTCFEFVDVVNAIWPDYLVIGPFATYWGRLADTDERILGWATAMSATEFVVDSDPIHVLEVRGELVRQGCTT